MNLTTEEISKIMGEFEEMSVFVSSTIPSERQAKVLTAALNKAHYTFNQIMAGIESMKRARMIRENHKRPQIAELMNLLRFEFQSKQESQEEVENINDDNAMGVFMDIQKDLDKGIPYNQICFDRGYVDWFEPTLPPPNGMEFKIIEEIKFRDKEIYGLFENNELLRIIEPNVMTSVEVKEWSEKIGSFYALFK